MTRGIYIYIMIYYSRPIEKENIAPPAKPPLSQCHSYNQNRTQHQRRVTHFSLLLHVDSRACNDGAASRAEVTIHEHSQFLGTAILMWG